MEEIFRKTIVLVEDETDIRAIYKEVLLDAGYDVKDFADGSEAYKYLTTEHWDLVLLDIMIPGIDGLTILKNLKQNNSLALKPVVLLTVLDNENVIMDGYGTGADGYLIKSEIDPSKIVAEVQNFFNELHKDF